MTRNEAGTILQMIAYTYPNFHVSPDAISTMKDVWAAALADDEYEAIKTALICYIKTDTSGFAPGIGKLRQLALGLAQPETDDTEEMADLVRRAVSNSSYHASEEFEALPPLVQRAVGSSNTLRAWGQVTTEELENIQLSHFRRIYRNLKEQERKREALMPLDKEKTARIKEFVSSIAERISADNRKSLIGNDRESDAPGGYDYAGHNNTFNNNTIDSNTEYNGTGHNDTGYSRVSEDFEGEGLPRIPASPATTPITSPYIAPATAAPNTGHVAGPAAPYAHHAYTALANTPSSAGNEAGYTPPDTAVSPGPGETLFADFDQRKYNYENLKKRLLHS